MLAQDECVYSFRDSFIFFRLVEFEKRQEVQVAPGSLSRGIDRFAVAAHTNIGNWAIFVQRSVRGQLSSLLS